MNIQSSSFSSHNEVTLELSLSDASENLSQFAVLLHILTQPSESCKICGELTLFRFTALALTICITTLFLFLLFCRSDNSSDMV